MYFVAPRCVTRIVQRDFTEVFRDNNNELQTIQKSPVIYAKFDRTSVPYFPYEFRVIALEHFNGTRRVPARTGGEDDKGNLQGTAFNLPNHVNVGNTQGGHTAGAKGKTAVFEADDPLGKLGIIDTENVDQVDPEYREMTEAYLLDPQNGYGTRWLSFSSKLAPPWATYDNLSGEGIVRKVIERIEDDGHDPNYVLKYERENKNRHSLIKAIEEHVTAQTV